MDSFAPCVCDFIFEFPCTSVENYGRFEVKTSISFFRMIRRPHVPRIRYQVPGMYTAAVRTAAAVVSSRYPDRTAVRKG